MKNKNLSCLDNYTEQELNMIFAMFLLGSFGLVVGIICCIYDYIQDPYHFDKISYTFYFGVTLLAILPNLTLSIIAKLESNKIVKKHKLFNKLLADHVTLSLLDDHELRKEWSVLRKVFLLRIDELVQQNYIDKINYEYDEYDKDINVNKFIRELIDYKKKKDNDRQALASQIKTAEVNKIKERADYEKAIDLLNKHKNRSDAQC